MVISSELGRAWRQELWPERGLVLHRRDDVIAVDVARLPREPAARVDREGEGVMRAVGDEVLARRAAHVLARDLGIGAHSLRERLHGHASADPSIGVVARVHELVLAPSLGAEVLVGGEAYVVAAPPSEVIEGETVVYVSRVA